MSTREMKTTIGGRPMPRGNGVTTSEEFHGWTSWRSYAHVEPGLSEYAFEAWERMTYGGISIGDKIARGYSILIRGRYSYVAR